MKNKVLSLTDLVRLREDEELSEKYVRYIAGLPLDKQYRHQEILDISVMLACTKMEPSFYSGFIYSYELAHLNKQFDLLRITKNNCLNIEIKSEQISLLKIEKQLKQNKHYLKMLNRNVCLYTFISSTENIYSLDENNSLIEVSLDDFKKAFNDIEIDEIDLDTVFAPRNYLVSPFNNPNAFLEGKYLLTENQETIKKDILATIENAKEQLYIGLTGGPGTGKTLLLYDIAKELSKSLSVLIIHSGIICEGMKIIDSKVTNLMIIEARMLRNVKIDAFDCLFIDESQRTYPNTLKVIIDSVAKKKGIGVFSFDPNQRLSFSEKRYTNAEEITSVCGKNLYTLTNTIRSNKDIMLFVDCLFNTAKWKETYHFKNISIKYVPNEREAVASAKQIENYLYISYTPSNYKFGLEYQVGRRNTHQVIGQEFDNVVMVLNSYFYYENKKLMSNRHPCPNYDFSKLLYQGLTRARNKISLIITTKGLFKDIIKMFQNND